MTVEEFSDQFDVLVQNYRQNAEFGKDSSAYDMRFDEYEKSVFLTMAQKEFVRNFYAGRNSYGLSVESTEEVRKQLNQLVCTYSTSNAENQTTENPGDFHLADNENGGHIYTFFKCPNDIWWILYEEAQLSSSSDSCIDGTYSLVTPTTHDELYKQLGNPFRGPSEKRILRLDVESNLVELISKHNIGKYIMRYMKEPSPIVLTDMTHNIDGRTVDKGFNHPQTCMLNDQTHDVILQIAVSKAIASKSAGRSSQ